MNNRSKNMSSIKPNTKILNIYHVVLFNHYEFSLFELNLSEVWLPLIFLLFLLILYIVINL